MRSRTTLELDGREYVVLRREEYDRLVQLAKLAESLPHPEPDADGNLPAVEFLRTSIARDLLRARIELGLTQRELAGLASVRVETLCRIETGKHTASTATLDKLERALERCRKKVAKKARRKRGR